MLEFNLEYYRTFYYVSKLGNLTKAARALYVSQPAVSRAISELEKRLDAKLFIRKARGMALTPEGEKLFRHVSAALDSLIQGEQELRRLHELVSGTIRIAATETPLFSFLMPKIQSFKNEYPNIHFEISGSSSVETITLLKSGAVDFALGVSPIEPDSDLNICEGGRIDDIFVAGPQFRHLAEQVLTAKEISAYPLITVERGTSARACIDMWFEEQGIFFVPAYSVRTSTNIIPFVEQNFGIGIIPSIFARNSIAENRMFEIALVRPLPTRRILILHRNNDPLAPLGNQFLNHLLTE